MNQNFHVRMLWTRRLAVSVRIPWARWGVSVSIIRSSSAKRPGMLNKWEMDDDKQEGDYAWGVSDDDHLRQELLLVLFFAAALIRRVRTRNASACLQAGADSVQGGRVVIVLDDKRDADLLGLEDAACLGDVQP